MKPNTHGHTGVHGTGDEACERKVRYLTKGRARDSAKRQSGASGLKLYTYECPNCGGWHITKMPPATYRQSQRALP